MMDFLELFTGPMLVPDYAGFAHHPNGGQCGVRNQTSMLILPYQDSAGEQTWYPACTRDG